MDERNSLQVNVESKELREILKKTSVEKPKFKDIEALRRAFNEHPGLWKSLGDMSRVVEGRLIGSFAGIESVREAMLRQAEETRRSFGYEDASPAERMLIDNILITQLDYLRAQITLNGQIEQGTAINNADFLERRTSGAHRRYMQAITTLARVRKMGLSGPMQINIAENQNVINTLLQYVAERMDPKKAG